MMDRDLGVCLTACRVAHASGKREFLQPFLVILATKQNEWVWRKALAGAKALGGGYELLEICADCLVAKEIYPEALRHLQSVLEIEPAFGGTKLSRAERVELCRQWRAFLRKHEDAIRQGKRFPLTDPDVSPALFGRARDWPGATPQSAPKRDDANKR